jgi:VWFA-related protein
MPFASYSKGLRVILYLVCLLIAPSKGTLAQLDNRPLLIALSVLVTDSAGQPVKNLQQSSFQLSEGGKNKLIALFSAEELPVRYGLVMDNSGSTRPFSQQVREAARLIIANTKPVDRGFIISLSGGGARVLSNLNSNDKGLFTTLEQLEPPNGPTRIIDAIYECPELFGDSNGSYRKALVIITDGVDNSSKHSLEQLTRRLNKAVQMFAIGFVQHLDDEPSSTSVTSPSSLSTRLRLTQRERAVKLLETVAEETGGRVLLPKSRTELSNATKVLDWIRSEYTLSYETSSPTDKDSFREIRVRVKVDGSDKYKVTTRRHVVVFANK